jgi:bacteriocin biosynthesis cyclodehydratase domain-containing protein
VAGAVRVRHSQPWPATIASQGPFGERVSEILVAELGGCRKFGATGATLADALATTPGPFVLALARPDMHLCESVDRMSWQHQVPWLPVVMEHPVIRVGPVICPPGGPCFCCFAGRRAQHDREPWVTASLDTAYASDGDWGPRGYLPHHARMAAALVHSMLERLASHDSGVAAGEVATIHLLAGAVSTSRVVARHGCDRCGAGSVSDRPDWLGELSGRVLARSAGHVAGDSADSSALR